MQCNIDENMRVIRLYVFRHFSHVTSGSVKYQDPLTRRFDSSI